MINLRKMGIIILTLTTLLTGCSTDDTPLTLEDRIEKMLCAPYSARCEAIVRTNNTENKYSYTCNRAEGGAYTVDYGDMTVAVDDYDAVISKGGSEIKAKITKDEIALLPTCFFNEYLSGGKVSPSGEGFVMESRISGDNPYRCKAQMLLTAELVPQKMNVMDKDGNIVIEVNIAEFSNG